MDNKNKLKMDWDLYESLLARCSNTQGAAFCKGHNSSLSEAKIIKENHEKRIEILKEQFISPSRS